MNTKSPSVVPSGFSMNRLIFLIFVGFALIWVLLFLTKWISPSSNRGGLDVGQTLPVIQAAGWVNGAPPDLTGKVVVVDAWATWCGPCRAQAPEMVELHQKYAGRNDVVFIGLTSEGAEALPGIENFVHETNITWPNGYGAENTLSDLEVIYIPSVWVTDRQGKIVWNYESSGTLEQAISKALK